jgi:thiosulfate/3-mercaptopyruvate sulfurtransferase
MRPVRLALLLAMFVPLAPSRPTSPPVGAHSTGDDFVVSTAWLAEHLRDPNLVLLEVGPKESYHAGHIPGAQFANFHSWMAPHRMDMDMHKEETSSGPHPLNLELPPQARLDSAIDAAGISSNSIIVVYFGKDWVTPSARLFLTLDYAGLRGHVFYLDGGIRAWQAEGKPVTTEVPIVRSGTFKSSPRSDVVVTASWVNGHLHDPHVRIVDARDSQFYTDSVDNHMPRGGHIAGAASIPYESVTDTTVFKLKDKAELAQMFASAGIVPGSTVVSYCHIGQQGSLLYLVARYLGYDARLYDGSFEDWSAHPELPIEGARRSASNAR